MLNLFDIVRLDNSTKDTTSQAQLICRGARYYPFLIYNFDEKFKRKFDNVAITEKELVYLEKLSYHSTNDSAFINELQNELRQKGLIDYMQEHKNTN
ncbi:hypothetical protein [Campylobacter sp. LR286c]|uniref:hypothetical protein n=1 Tax=Campylobacter sp. LR286c TaxID=2593545 RepID=UPI0016813061|nr:hypothetical protein [Campylobacter sp. LR286c]